MEYLSSGVEETYGLAREFAKKLSAGDVVAFFGDVGAGKTHFVQGLCSVLCPGIRVTSPTFAIVNQYEGELTIYHFDMYRIESFESLYSTGFFDYLEAGGVCVIEWSENIEAVLPEARWNITMERCGEENGRRITIERNEPHHENTGA